jgi:glycosyltransferase involved in cell wall biosynthesis
MSDSIGTQSSALLLQIVVPCYNEEEVLADTCDSLIGLLEKMIKQGLVDRSSSILFVDDGSKDQTWQLIERLASDKHSVQGLKLARNVGHQNALLAGLEFSTADAVLSIDADLQDDIEVVPEMVESLNSGVDVVYGVRRGRESDTIFKRTSARAYYTLLRKMGVSIVPDHADFRLMSRRAIDRLLEYSEVNLFLRGIVPLIADRVSFVFYDRQARTAGETKYPLKKMIGLAIDGVTSFSASPLRFIAGLGLLTFVASILMAGWALWARVFTDTAIPGWASSVIPIYFLGGVQLLSIGVLGEYVAKVYLEAKRRPKYFIDYSTPAESNTSQEHQPTEYRRSRMQT